MEPTREAPPPDTPHSNHPIRARAAWFRRAWGIDALPLHARRSYRLELTATFFFTLAIACIEGGVVAVFAKQTFAGLVPKRSLAFAVALVGAAPEIANLASFLWTQLGQGRRKVPLINAMQAAVLALVAALAFMPASPAGLWMLVGFVMLARVSWSGMLTLRPTVWRANYPPEVRATVVGRFSTVQTLLVASMGIALGAWMDRWVDSFRVVLPLAALLACVGLFSYSKIRMRDEQASLAQERSSPDNVLRPWEGPKIVLRVLREDPHFAWYMLWMFALGLGNLMLTPVLAITLKDHFQLGYLSSILIISAIPQLVTSAAIPQWARLLDRVHIVRFRAIHGWSFVVSTGVLALASLADSVPLLFLGAVLQGIGFGGGALAWNLGHVDFAPPTRTSQYMATHVTLNGLRGLIAPFGAVALYDLLRGLPVGTDESGHPVPLGPVASAPVFLLSTILCVVGTVGFARLARRMGSLAGARARGATPKEKAAPPGE